MQAIRILPLLLILVGCSESQRTPATRRTTATVPTQSHQTIDQPDHLPTHTEGEWVPASELRAAIVTLKDARFETMQPLPEEGYVPIQATAPTVSATIVNNSDRYVARVRVRVRAFASESGRQLAEEITAVPGWYWLTPPRSSKSQVFVLNNDGPFAVSAEWPDFTVETEIVDVQFVSVPAAAAVQPSPDSDNRDGN